MRGKRTTTAAAGWPHDFSGAVGQETPALCVASCRGLTGPWPCGFALCGLGRCVTWAGRADGSLAFWGICVGLLLLLWVDDAGAWARTLPCGGVPIRWGLGGCKSRGSAESRYAARVSSLRGPAKHLDGRRDVANHAGEF